MDFDPSTATPVDEPVVETPTATSFDPVSAVPVEDAAATHAIEMINAGKTGQVHLTYDDYVALNKIAQQGKPTWQRTLDVVGPAVKQLGAMTGQTITHPIQSIQEAASSIAPEHQGSPLEQTRDVAVGAFRGIQGLVPAAVSLAGAVDPVGPVLDVFAPKLGQEYKARENALSDVAQQGAEQAGEIESNITGENRQSIASKTGEFVAPLIAGGPEGASLAEKAPAIAENIVGKGQKIANQALGAAASGASRAAPAVTTAGGMAGSAAIAHTIGHNPLFDLMGALTGAIGGETSGLRQTITKVIQAPLDRIAQDAKAIASAPEGMTRIRALQYGLTQEAQRITGEAQALSSAVKVGSEDARLLSARSSDGSFLFDSSSDALSPLGKKIRAREEQAQALMNRVQTIDGQAHLSRFYQDVAKYGIATGITTGEGAAIGGAIAGASNPPESSEGIAESAAMGAGLGLGGGTLGARSGFKQLDADAIRSRSTIDPAHISDLPQPTQDYLNAHAGLADARGQKVQVLPEEQFLKALTSGEEIKPEDIQFAPSGFYDPESGTAYINKDGLREGVVPHEVTHALDQASGLKDSKYGKLLDKHIDENWDKPEFKQAVEEYEKQLSDNLDRPVKLDKEQVKSELTAALGADIMSKTRPEDLSGGESTGQFLARKFRQITGRESPLTEQFGFPVTPELRSELTRELYKAGEDAKFGIKPSQTEAHTGAAPEHQDAIDTAIKARMAMFKESRKAAAQKIGQAYDGMKPEDVTAENLFKESAKGPSFMPSDDPRGIKEAAIRWPDGTIRTGLTHDHIQDKYGFPDKLDLHPETGNYGFITNSDEFLTSKQAYLRAKELKQMPDSYFSHELEGGIYSLDSRAAAGIRDDGHFMPSFTHYSDIPGIKELDPMLSGTGNAGAEKARMRDYPELWVPKTYVGLEGYEKERGLGNQVYKGDTGEPLYDITKDPEDFIGKAYDQLKKSDEYSPYDKSAALSMAEGLIRDAGYKGYRNGTVAALFGKTKVEPQFMPSKPMANIGLKIDKTGEIIKPEDALDILKKHGINVTKHSVHASGSEPTLVATLDKHATPEQLHSVAQDLDQEAVAYHLGEGIGELYGPKADNWKPFSPEYFLDHDGKPVGASPARSNLSDVSPEPEAPKNESNAILEPKEGRPEKDIKQDISAIMIKGYPSRGSRRMVRLEQLRGELQKAKLLGMANEQGLEHKGDMEGKLQLFNDPATGSTIAVKTGASPEELAGKVEQSRAKFANRNVQFMPSGHPEAIEQAAVRDEDTGKIYTGDLHSFAESNLREDKGLGEEDRLGNITEGFVDRKGNFHDREQAFEHAAKINQLARAEVDRHRAWADKWGEKTGLESQSFEGDRRFMPSDNPEAIDKAAVRFPDGKVFTGWIHPDAWAKGVDEYSAEQLGKWIREHGDDYVERGYVLKPDQNGHQKFITADEALAHAKSIGQMTDESQNKAEEFYGTKQRGKLEGGRGLEALTFQKGRQFMPSGFYSPLERTVAEKMPDKATPDQLRGIVGTGVKKAELEWSGINDLIDQAKQEGRSITKQEALDWVRANTPDIKEVQLGGINKWSNNELMGNNGPVARLTRNGDEWGYESASGRKYNFTGTKEEAMMAAEESFSRLLTEAGVRRQGGDAKYAQYQLPEGENYRELLMTLKRDGNENTALRDWERQAALKYGPAWQPHDLTQYESDKWNDLVSRGSNPSENFRSSHFDEPNVVGHLRVNDRTLPDGSKMLFAEELQSDWAQKGRREGFRSPVDWKNLTVRRDPNKNIFILTGDGRLIESRYKTTDGKTDAEVLDQAAKDNPDKTSGEVPDMPFKGEAWKKLLLRNLIRHAVDEGYDSVGWTTGEQQAERYDLSKQVDRVSAFKNGDGTFDISARLPSGDYQQIGNTIPTEKLADYVGKELAQKIQDQKVDGKEYQGADLKVGGEGMKGFYDKELVNLANDIGKKFGAKAEQAGINAGELPDEYSSRMNPGTGRFDLLKNGNPIETDLTGNQLREKLSQYHESKVWKLPITEAMRDSVKTQGQPLFMPSPIGTALDGLTGKIAADTEEEFWNKAWPKLMKSTGLTQSSGSEKSINKAAAAAVEDVHRFLNENPRFKDYYNKDWDETQKALEDHYGRKLTDDELAFFKLAKGLTSPNTALPINVADALNVTDQWLKDGNLDSIKMGISPKGNRVLAESPVSISGTTNSIKAFTLKAVDKLSQELGGPKKVADYLMAMVPVGELQEFNKSLGYKGSVGKLGSIKELVEQATGQSEKIPRMFVFGRKVGAYTLNLLGDHKYQTIDAWESRFIRSQFRDMFTGVDALPKGKDEHTLFTKFTQIFNEEFKKQTGLNLDNSALQAARWFYMIDAARKAGYTGTSTSETISHYVKKELSARSQKGGGLSGVEAPQGAEDGDPF